MTKAERDTMTSLITEMADNISKSKYLIYNPIIIKYRLKVNPVASKGGCGILSIFLGLQRVDGRRIYRI
jgi:hypothetical protein